MRTIQKLYRANYHGEDVTTEMTYLNGTWNTITENVANMVTNEHVSNKAVVIGNGVSRKTFDLSLLAHHKGGLLASGAVQTYGCNAIYRDHKFRPHFTVANGPKIIDEISKHPAYTTNNIVYTNAKGILEHPGKFYLTPQDPSWNAGAIATYLACFDGHKTVYLLGFDGVDSDWSGYNMYAGTHGYDEPSYGYNEEFQTLAMLEVFNTYNDVDFVRVMPTDTFRIPERWKYVSNFRQITFYDLALEIDL